MSEQLTVAETPAGRKLSGMAEDILNMMKDERATPELIKELDALIERVFSLMERLAEPEAKQ